MSDYLDVEGMKYLRARGIEVNVPNARTPSVNIAYLNQYILDKLVEAVGTERSARFVCAIACVFPDGTKKVTRATIEGEIAMQPAGENGFGYDPIFYVPEYGKTTAQLSMEEKNKISHRAKALEEMKKEL